jgi:hypothetical protein
MPQSSSLVHIIVPYHIDTKSAMLITKRNHVPMSSFCTGARSPDENKSWPINHHSPVFSVRQPRWLKGHLRVPISGCMISHAVSVPDESRAVVLQYEIYILL